MMKSKKKKRTSRKRAQRHEYKSLEDYQKRFFPKSPAATRAVDNPQKYGENLAKESLRKFSRILLV